MLDLSEPGLAVERMHPEVTQLTNVIVESTFVRARSAQLTQKCSFHSHQFIVLTIPENQLMKKENIMTTFNEDKAYKPQEEVFFDDGREIELLHFVYSQDDLNEIRGSPERVLAAIDEYGRTRKYLMNVGEDKGKIVIDLIAKTKPKLMVDHFLPPLVEDRI